MGAVRTSAGGGEGTFVSVNPLGGPRSRRGLRAVSTQMIETRRSSGWPTAGERRRLGSTTVGRARQPFKWASVAVLRIHYLQGPRRRWQLGCLLEMSVGRQGT